MSSKFLNRRSPSGPKTLIELPFYLLTPVASSTIFVGGFAAPAGSAGTDPKFGHFFALMPGDNAATVAVGAPVEFPQNGSASGVVRSSASSIILPDVGIYEVFYQVSVDEAGQLVVGLDSGSGVVELANTVAGRATGTSQIINDVLVPTSVPNSLLTVRNPTGNAAALTITPIAGGTHPVSATLLVQKIAPPSGSIAPSESSSQYRMPAPGTLFSLTVQNNPVGANPTVTTYRVRKNGVNVATPLNIANNAAGPVELDLSGISVVEGDLISISATSPAFAGTAPTARISLTWLPQ